MYNSCICYYEAPVISILLFFYSKYLYIISVIEGVVLYKDGTNPYIGDMFHESPLVLLLFSWVTQNFSMQWINAFFICCDLLTSYVLYKASKVYLLELVGVITSLLILPHKVDTNS